MTAVAPGLHIVGPIVNEPHRRDGRSFFASCECGASVRSERRGVVQGFVDGHALLVSCSDCGRPSSEPLCSECDSRQVLSVAPEPAASPAAPASLSPDAPPMASGATDSPDMTVDVVGDLKAAIAAIEANNGYRPPPFPATDSSEGER